MFYGKIILSLAGCVARIERLTKGQVVRAYAGAFIFRAGGRGLAQRARRIRLSGGKNTEELNKEEGIA